MEPTTKALFSISSATEAKPVGGAADPEASPFAALFAGVEAEVQDEANLTAVPLDDAVLGEDLPEAVHVACVEELSTEQPEDPTWTALLVPVAEPVEGSVDPSLSPLSEAPAAVVVEGAASQPSQGGGDSLPTLNDPPPWSTSTPGPATAPAASAAPTPNAGAAPAAEAPIPGASEAAPAEAARPSTSEPAPTATATAPAATPIASAPAPSEPAPAPEAQQPGTAAAPSAEGAAEAGAQGEPQGDDGRESGHQRENTPAVSEPAKSVQFAPAAEVAVAGPAARIEALAGPARAAQSADAALPQLDTVRLAHELEGLVRAEQREARLALRPAELGRVDVSMKMVEGRLEVHIAPQSDAAFQALSAEMRGLVDALQKADIPAVVKLAQAEGAGADANANHSSSGGGPASDGSAHSSDARRGRFGQSTQPELAPQASADETPDDPNPGHWLA